jgi:hypothetical protein
MSVQSASMSMMGVSQRYGAGSLEETSSSASSAYSTQSSHDSAPNTHSPNPLDQNAYQLSYHMHHMSLQQLPATMLSAVVSAAAGPGSDSGTSSVDHTISEQDARIAAANEHLPNGPWYFEVAGAGDDGPLSALRGTRNSTAQVPVPSSEHVAEIVGRQGCKIKALRAKTNTYIKTPVRGEQPCFVITGRQEDVDVAKHEIEQAADHFTQIRASRRHSQGGQPIPGHITAYVRVPYRVVGLVVGPKGGTIKRIQQDTHTYIITPSREREPIFEVTGLPANVEKARVLIEDHILQRTGVRPSTDCVNGDYNPQQSQQQQPTQQQQQQQHQPMSVQNMADYAAYLSANNYNNSTVNNMAHVSDSAAALYNNADVYQQQTFTATKVPQHDYSNNNNNNMMMWGADTYVQPQQQQQQAIGTYPTWSNNSAEVQNNNNAAGQGLQGLMHSVYNHQQFNGMPAYSLNNNNTNNAMCAGSFVDCTRDEGIGGSPLDTYPCTWSTAAQSSVEWSMPSPPVSQQHSTSNNNSDVLKSRPMVVPQSPNTDSWMQPPSHLIMSSIWSDLNNPTDL